MKDGLIIEAKNLDVSFYIQGHGMNSLKEFVMSLGTKKPFVRKQVLFNFNLEVKTGECLGILGRNGSGKSTLLRVLSGIIKPDKGSLKINGVIAPLLALGVGLEPELNGYENIKLCGSLMKLSRDRNKEVVNKVMDFSELTHEQLSMQVKRYSSGMISRLGFSIATSFTPEILIIDEALSVGDAFFVKKCRDRIKEIQDAGSTILFVSHSTNDILQICETGICIEEGKVTKKGPIKEVVDYYLAKV